MFPRWRSSELRGLAAAAAVLLLTACGKPDLVEDEANLLNEEERRRIAATDASAAATPSTASFMATTFLPTAWAAASFSRMALSARPKGEAPTRQLTQ